MRVALWLAKTRFDMIFEHSDYRSYLRAELSERIARNSAYSLRALARQIDCAASTLSEILKGTKGLSESKAFSVAQKLGLPAAEAEYFTLLVSHDRAQTPDARDFCLQKMRALHPQNVAKDLGVDAFKLIADWYHLAVLELANLSEFTLTAESAAERLTISPLEARTALDRLERLELVHKNADGSYARAEGRNLVTSAEQNAALRRYHEQMLAKAAASLAAETPAQRFVGSETFAMDSALLPEAEKLAEKFFTDLVELARRSKRRDRVYHLGVQLFGLTRSLPRKRKGVSP